MANNWWFPWHHEKFKCFMPAACVDNSLQLSISAETIQTASHFKLLSALHLSMARCQSGSLLYPLTSVLCTIAAHIRYMIYPIVPYPVKFIPASVYSEAVRHERRSQMQGGKNWILPKEINANWFFWDSHWLEIWKNHLCPSIGPNGGSVAMDSGFDPCILRHSGIWGAEGGSVA